MRIVVPVDGSAPALRAVRHALQLIGGREEGEIVLVNVQDPFALGVSEISAAMTGAADRKLAARRSRAALRRAAALCRNTGARFTERAEIGPVGETVARVARSVDADQIVMGTRGLGTVRRMVLGSVASRLVPLARVPVTLVK